MPDIQDTGRLPNATSDAIKTVDRLDAKKLSKAKAELRQHLMKISSKFTGLDWTEEDDQFLDIATLWVEKQAQRSGLRNAQS